MIGSIALPFLFLLFALLSCLYSLSLLSYIRWSLPQVLLCNWISFPHLNIYYVLLYIYTALEAIQLAADTNPYTKGISLALQSQLPKIEQTIPEISSPNVTLEWWL